RAFTLLMALAVIFRPERFRAAPASPSALSSTRDPGSEAAIKPPTAIATPPMIRGLRSTKLAIASPACSPALVARSATSAAADAAPQAAEAAPLAVASVAPVSADGTDDSD